MSTEPVVKALVHREIVTWLVFVWFSLVPGGEVELFIAHPPPASTWLPSAGKLIEPDPRSHLFWMFKSRTSVWASDAMNIFSPCDVMVAKREPHCLATASASCQPIRSRLYTMT